MIFISCKENYQLFKKANIHSINTFYIGAHKGESIDFFSKFEIKIYSFEASLKILEKKICNKFIFRKYCFKLKKSTKYLINVIKALLQLSAMNTK